MTPRDTSPTNSAGQHSAERVTLPAGEFDGAWPSILDALSDAVMLLDPDQRILYCNASCLRLATCSADKLIGRQCWEALHGTDGPLAECPFKRLKASAKRESMELEKNGRWYQVTVDPLRLAGTDRLGAVHIVRDITQRKEAQRQLEELNHTLEQRVHERTVELQASREKYRGLLENTLDIPFRVDGDGVVTYIGPQAHRYGFDPANMEGRPFVDYIFSEDKPAIAKAFEKALRTGRAVPTQFRIQAPVDETLRWFEERSTLQRDAHGRAVGLTGVLRDITERKYEEQIRLEQQKRLHDLAAKLASAQDEEQRRIAHGLHDDVAQLLTAALMKMAVARRTHNPAEADTVRRELEELLRSANQKVRLLSFELASSTLYRLGIEDALTELCEGMSERYGIDVTLHADANPKPLAASSATVLFKAARELLFNVVKHAQSGKAVVDLRRTDGTILLSVRDHGIGFATCDESNRSPRAGKGLGLFEIRERLRDLGGNVDIQSVPDAGTRVTLSIPLNEKQTTDDLIS